MILHYGVLDKFIEPFVKMVNEEFGEEKHIFIFGGNIKKWFPDTPKNFIHVNKFKHLGLIIYYIYRADKIIAHGLFHDLFTKLIFFQPWILKKIYWVVWGGDLEKALKENKLKTFSAFIRNRVIRNIGHCVTYIKGDYDLIRKIFNSKAKLHECFLYTTNIYKSNNLEKTNFNHTSILLGNSATKSNNHFDSFDILKKYKNENIKIYCPLSYGDKDYGIDVANEGKRIFGEKFIPLIDFMPFSEYMNILNEIDIALFNHDRQQAMGNTITLLGMGKKVYIRKNTGVWDSLNHIGVKVFDIDDFNLDKTEQEANQKIISEYFSYEKLIKQWSTILE